MPAPTETLWEMEPHTAAKHAILRRYLGAWFGIMGGKNPRVIYLDGFCGPGRYKKGEEGSPIIALKLAIDHNQQNRINNCTFLFVDENKDRIDHLKSELDKIATPNNFIIFPIQNQFEDTLTELLDNMDAKGERMAPTFAFIDPFGFKGAPFRLVERLLNNPKTEVFINIMADSINRFTEHPDDQVKKHIVELFGTKKVLEVINFCGNRVKNFKNLYQEQLEKCAKFVRYFEMRDRKNRIIYYLFFASNNALGHIKIKEAFWKVDQSSGFYFSDATNPNQPVLFKDDPSQELAVLLTKEFQGKRKSVYEIRQYVEDKTPYLATHMKKAMCNLENKDELSVEPLKLNGSKRRRNSFPDDVIVTFPVPF